MTNIRYDQTEAFHASGQVEVELRVWLDAMGYWVIKRTHPDNIFDPIDSWLVGSDLLIEHRMLNRDRQAYLAKTEEPLWLAAHKPEIARALGVQTMAIWHDPEPPYDPVFWWDDIRKLPPGSELVHPPDVRDPEFLDDRVTFPYRKVSRGWDGILGEFDNARAQGNSSYDFYAHFRD